MIVFLSFIFLLSLISTAAAKTAPDDMPPVIPSYLAKFLEKFNADVLLIEITWSIIFTSSVLGIKPAPIPWIEWDPGSFPLITAESSGSTAKTLIESFFFSRNFQLH